MYIFASGSGAFLLSSLRKVLLTLPQDYSAAETTDSQPLLSAAAASPYTTLIQQKDESLTRGTIGESLHAQKGEEKQPKPLWRSTGPGGINSHST